MHTCFCVSLKIHYLIPCSFTSHNKHGSMVFRDSIFNQVSDPIVYLQSHHVCSFSTENKKGIYQWSCQTACIHSDLPTSTWNSCIDRQFRHTLGSWLKNNIYSTVFISFLVQQVIVSGILWFPNKKWVPPLCKLGWTQLLEGAWWSQRYVLN